jgi:glutathione S-transferase
MKLYTYDPAPNPRRLQLFLDYKGIEVDTVQIDMLKQQQFAETFRKINPMCTVPALVLDDGTVLTEVIGACVYLDEIFPERPLMGTTPLEKALIISWNHRLFYSLYHAIADVFRNGNPAFAGRALPGPQDIAQIPQLVDRGKQRMEAAWRMVDRALTRQPFLAGEHFSFADIDLLVCVDFARWIKESVPEECKHIQAWLPRARAALEQ